MKENVHTVLLGPRLVLVPYAEKHVAKYHEWMSSAELRDLTASEPLTLQEEYEMQQTWQKDDDKLTFIVLSRHAEDGLAALDGNAGNLHLSPEDPRIAFLPMIGDVNLFLKGDRPSITFEGNETREEGGDMFEVEVEIMIAERAFRGKGLAIETLLLLLTYATGQYLTFVHPPIGGQENTHSHLHPFLSYIQTTQSPEALSSIVTPHRLVARISESNVPSIRLFEKLGFKVVRTVEVFHEVEMRWKQMSHLQSNP